MKFTTLPDFVFPDIPGEFGALETAIELAGLTNTWVRLSAADQRRLLGFAVFGKQEVRVDDDSIVSVRRSIAFGQDFERAEYSHTTIAKACDCHKLLTPSSISPRHFSC
jgi:hypothetical protein